MTFLKVALSLLLIVQNVDSFVPQTSSAGKQVKQWQSPREACLPMSVRTTTTHTTPSRTTLLNRRHYSTNKRRTNIPSTTAVSAIPPTVASAVGHVIAGNLATPFVIDAVKGWYARIPLPSWTPPDRVFAPTWLTLYSMIGVAVARVATTAAGGWKSTPVLLWGVHMILNLLWAPLFFGMAKLRAALVVNYCLALSLPILIKLFAAVDGTAALLLVPYTLWITFATILNQAICKLNPMDGSGYSNAMLEADISKLQKDAAKKVEL